MDYCKYHPLSGATYRCQQCGIYCCDKCIDDDSNGGEPRCFHCNNFLENLGSANTVEPFWRRLQEAFRYPLNSSSISIIVFTAILSTIAVAMPFLFILAILLGLFAGGSMLKYSFSCLERTAMGEMKAPDVMEAYHGGIKLIAQLVFISTVVTAVVVGGGYLGGLGLAGFLGIIAVVVFPAVLIRFAQSESVLDALNPMNVFRMIGAIGLPYGLLLAFLMIMMSSVGLLNELTHKLLPAVSLILQSIISNYYTVVIFHLMGYMLFQYQRQLGYVARKDDDEAVRSDAEHLAAKIDVFLKEGDYEQVVRLFYQAFKSFPLEAQFFEKYFDFLYACKKPLLMIDYGTTYLEFMIQRKRFDKITMIYKQILHLAPEFLPTSPSVRLLLAQRLKQQGDLKLTVKLLNGMHKLFPEFVGLNEAYLLMAEAFSEMPGMGEHAEKCRRWVVQNQAKEKEAAERGRQQPEPVPQAVAKSTQPSGVKQKRQAPPAVRKSGLTLELVPLDTERKNNE